MGAIISSVSLPIGATAQSRVHRAWERAVLAGERLPGVRDVVWDSWQRSAAVVPPTLRAAPQVWDADALRTARLTCDWMPFAIEAIGADASGFTDGGHILALFDADGRMLDAHGDPEAITGLADINFRPGACWSESVAGTNGPGTALATGHAVHVVGHEHFVHAWQPWHCAAVPVRDALTRAVIGAVDLSGFHERAHPHTLSLAAALALAIEQMLGAREMRRRAQLLQRHAALLRRWPGDVQGVMDRNEALLDGALPAAPVGGWRAVLARAEAGDTTPAEWELPNGRRAFVEPVMDGLTVIGACVVLPAAARRGSTRYAITDLAGDDPAIRDAARLATLAAQNDLPVLLLGESGTGKEVMAQGIHAASPRGTGPFIAVNCAAIPRDLTESELFGYVGGSFSGARKEGHAGKIEAAHGGTLFLDEIGDLPLPAQAALLRVLQEGELTRVGDTKSRPVDVRVVAATNRDLSRALADGQFRSDLFYRLGVLTVQMPPLRERRGDIRALAERFLRESAQQLGTAPSRYSAAALAALERHDWPGNVRELKNLARRLAALVGREEVGLDDLPPDVRGLRVTPAHGTPAPESIPEFQTGELPIPADLLAAVRSSKTMGEAAVKLGVTRSTLYRRIARLGLKVERFLAG
jgi:transcriptional regulator of acetoin/glycerol metabolism